MIALLYLVLFFLGASAASFAGVLLERGRSEESWLAWLRSVSMTRSICVGCHRVLARRQLLPIIGRALQKGKCRHCACSIPAWYSRREASMGVAFMLVFRVLLQHSLLYGGIYSVLFLQSLLLQWWLMRAMGSLLLADLLRYEVDLFFLALALGIGVWGSTLVGAPPLWWWSGALRFGLTFASMYGLSFFVSYVRHGVREAGLGGGDIAVAVVLGALAVPPTDLFWVSVVQYISLYMVLSSVCTLLLLAVYRSPNKILPFVPGMLIAWVLIPYVRAWYGG